MREIYKKVQDDVFSVVEVDLDALEYEESNPWLFSVFVKFDGFNENEQGYEEFLEAKESLIISLEHINKVKFVGFRVLDGWSEFYFYAPTSKGLDKAVLDVLSPSNYVFESNVVKDTKWDFYKKELYPTELEFIHMQSQRIIFLLQEEDDELSVTRDVEHYIVFDTSTQKDRFLQKIQELGFEYKDDISTDEYEYGVALVKNHNVLQESVDEVVEALYNELKKEHGYYEGWSTVLAKDI